MWQWPQFRALSFMRLFTSCAPIAFPAVGKRNMQDVSDRLWAFAIKGENVSQERFYTRVGHGRHHSPPSRNIFCRSAPYTTSRLLVSTRVGSCGRDG